MTETQNETRPGTSAEADKRTWLQKNGGTLFGIGTFVLLAIAAFLMWLANAS